MAFSLVKPNLELIPSYLEALKEGDFHTMQLGFGDAEPSEILADPAAYIAKITTPAPFSLTRKNQTFQITEHELLWITDGKRFLGTIAMRYAADDKLVFDYTGHIGMAVRPAILNKGYGIRTIQNLFSQLSEKAKSHGLGHILATCDPENRASKRLIEYFGGQFIDVNPSIIRDGLTARYKISLKTSIAP